MVATFRLIRNGDLWLAAHPHAAGSAPHDMGAVARLLQQHAGPVHAVPEPAGRGGPGGQLAGGRGTQQDIPGQTRLPSGHWLPHPGRMQGYTAGHPRADQTTLWSLAAPCRYKAGVLSRTSIPGQTRLPSGHWLPHAGIKQGYSAEHPRADQTTLWSLAARYKAGVHSRTSPARPDFHLVTGCPMQV